MVDVDGPDYSKTTYIDLSQRLPKGVSGKIGVARGLKGSLDFGLKSIDYFTGNTLIDSQLIAEGGVDVSSLAGSDVVVDKRNYVFLVQPTVGAGIALYTEFNIWGWNITMFYPKEGSSPPDLISKELTVPIDIPVPLSSNPAKHYPVPAIPVGGVPVTDTSLPLVNSGYSVDGFIFQGVNVSVDDASGTSTLSGYITASDGRIISGVVQFNVAGKSYAANVTNDDLGNYFSKSFNSPVSTETANIVFNNMLGGVAKTSIIVPAKNISTGGGVGVTPPTSVGSNLIFNQNQALIFGPEIQISGYVVDDLGNFPSGNVSFTLAGTQYTLSLINGGSNTGSSFIRMLPRPFYDEIIILNAMSDSGLKGTTTLFVSGTGGGDVNNASLSIIKPDSNSHWRVDTSHLITWNSASVDPNDVYRFELYNSSGVFVRKIGRRGANKRSKLISLANDIPGRYKIKMFNEVYQEQFAWSSEFEIRNVNSVPVIKKKSFVAYSGSEYIGQIEAFDLNDDALSFGVSVLPSKGIVNITANGSFNYTPNVGQLGSDSFTVTVSDGVATQSSVITVTIIDSNQLPDYKNVTTFTINSPLKSMVVENGKIYTADSSSLGNISIWDLSGTLLHTVSFNDNICGMDVSGQYLAVVDCSWRNSILGLYSADRLAPIRDQTMTNVDNPSSVVIGSGKIYVGYQRHQVEQIQFYNALSGVETPFSYISGDYRTYGKNINSLDYYRQTAAPNSVMLYAGDDAGHIIVWAAEGDTGFDFQRLTFGNDVMSVFARQKAIYGGTRLGELRKFSGNLSFIEDFALNNIHTGSINDIYSNSLELYTVGADGKLLILDDSNGVIRQSIPNAHSGSITSLGYDNGRIITADVNGVIKIWQRNFIPIVSDTEIVTWSNLEQSFNLDVVDLDPNDVHSYSIQTGATSGIATVSIDGIVTYTPGLNFIGTDTFVVAVSDGKDTSTLTVSVTVKNRPPEVGFGIQGGTGLSGVMPVGQTFSLLGYAVDPEGDVINSYSWSIESSPLGSVASITNATSQNASFTPDINGAYTFGLVASDGSISSTLITVDVMAITNLAPLASIQAPTSVSANTGMTGYIQVTDPNLLDTFTYKLITKPINGTVSLGADGRFTYIPNHGYAGVETFTIQVTDNWGATANSTITLTVENTPPIANDDTYALYFGNPLVTGNVLLNDKDINGDSLTISSYDKTSALGGGIVNNLDGTFTYNPLNGFSGNDTFTYTLSDGKGGFNTGKVFITLTGTQFNINFSGTGTGVVNGNLKSINCFGSCAYSLQAGSILTLNASPDPDSIFLGWSGGGCTGTGPCTVTINAAISITADFIRASELFYAPLITDGTPGQFGPDSRAYATTIDKNGSVYIAGDDFSPWGVPLSPHHNNGVSDMLIAKYDKQGLLLWHTFLGGLGYDYLQDITVDSLGNIVVVGKASQGWGDNINGYNLPPVNNANDYNLLSGALLVAKLDPSGKLLWHTFHNMQGYGAVVAVDMNDDIYITGNNAGVTKLNKNGQYLWRTNDFSGTDIHIDNIGSIYIAGESSGSWGNPINPYLSNSKYAWLGTNLTNTFVAKLDSTGNLLWNTFFDGYTRLGFTNTRIAVDTRNSAIYLASSGNMSWGSPIRPYTDGKDANGNDGYVAKLDINGILLWNTFLGGSGSDVIKDIALNSSGDIYISGNSSQTWGAPLSGISGNFLAKLDEAGNLLATRFVNWDLGLSVDTLDNVYLQSLTDKISIAKFGDRKYWFDYDGDLIPDKVEQSWGLDPRDPTDGGLDSDIDTYSDGIEYLANTDRSIQQSKPQGPSSGVYHLFQDDFADAVYTDRWALDRFSTNALKNNNVTEFGSQLDISIDAPIAPASCENAALDAFVAIKQPSFTVEVQNKITGSGEFCISLREVNNPASDTFVDICAINSGAAYTIEVRSNEGGIKTLTQGQALLNDPGTVPVQWQLKKKGDAFELLTRQGAAWQSQASFVNTRFATAELRPSLSVKNCGTTTATMSIEQFSILRDTDADTIPDMTDNCPLINNPAQSDADNDNIGDACDTGDTDQDTLSDQKEFQLGTDPTKKDSEGDGLPDNWEVSMGTNPLVDDANADPDVDGFSNLQEYLAGTNPTLKTSIPSKLRFIATSYIASKIDGIVTLPVTRTGGNTGTSSVQCETVNDTALAGMDYVALNNINGWLNWADGDSSIKYCTISLIGNTIAQGRTRFTVNLVTPAKGSLVGAPSMAEILLKYPTHDDFGGDGNADILIRKTNGFLAMYEMNGATRTLGAVGGLPNEWTVDGIGDFGGDGSADILIRKTDGFLAMYEMNGATRSLSAVGGLSNDWTVEGVGDFGGDGNADILIRKTNGFLAMYEMNGATRSLRAVGGLSSDWTVKGIGDFGGDGKADILIRKLNGFLAMYQMNGSVRSLIPVGGLSNDWKVKGVADFSGDGKADILIRKSNGFLAMYQMNGASRTLHPIGGLPLDWSIEQVGDFGGDGKADILIRKSNGFLAMYQMDGALRTLNAVGGLPTAWTIQPVKQPLL